MQAPLTALVLELTYIGFGLLVPLVIGTATATVVARQVDGYSIYSGRLAAPTPRQIPAACIRRVPRDRPR